MRSEDEGSGAAGPVEALRTQLAAGRDALAVLAAMKQAIYALGFGSETSAFQVLADNFASGGQLIDLIDALVKGRVSRTEIATFVLPAVSAIKSLSATEVARLLDIMVPDDRSPIGLTIKALSGTFARTAHLGQETFDHILQQRDGRQRQKAEVVARAIAQSPGAVRYLRDVLSRNDEDAVFAALCGLSDLNPSHELARAELSANATELRELTRSGMHFAPCRRLGWRFLCILGEIDDETSQLITTSARSGPTEAQIETAIWIWMRPRTSDPQLPERVDAIVNAAVADVTVRKVADDMLAALLIASSTRELALNALDTFATAQESGALGDELPSVYSSLQSDPALYSQVLTHALLLKNANLAWIKGLTFLGSVEPQLMRPDLSAFRAAAVEQRVRAIRRLIGTCHNGAAISIFMWELANCVDLASWSVNALEDVFSNFLRIEYPLAVKKFLEEHQKELPKGTALRAVVDNLIRSMRKWDAVLAKLPEAAELRPSEEKRLAFRAAQIRQMRDIERGARERSVMAQFATQFFIKQGEQTVMHVPGVQPTVTRLKSLSHTFELPSSELNDPLMGHWLRARYLSDR